MLLTTSDRLLGRDPESFNKFLSNKARDEQDKRFLEVIKFAEKQKQEEEANLGIADANLLETELKSMLQTRSIDFDFTEPDDASDKLIIFQAELDQLIKKHLLQASGLVIAGPLVAEALKLYRTILPQEEYDSILSHIYKTRNNIQAISLPDDISSKTIH